MQKLHFFVALALVASLACKNDSPPEPEHTAPAEGAEAPAQEARQDTPSQTYQIVARPPQNHDNPIEYEVVDADGVAVDLPDHVKQGVRTALRPTIFSQGRYLIYSDSGVLHLYDMQVKRGLELGTFNTPENTLVHYGEVSPDQRKFLAVASDEKGHGPTTLWIYTIDDGKVVGRQQEEINPKFRCAEDCTPEELSFRGDGTVVYMKNPEEGDPEPIMHFTVSLND